MAPHGVFPCAGKDRWIAIAVDGDEEWQALATASGIVDSRYTNFDGRRGNEDQLERDLAAWTSRFDADDLMQQLQGCGLAAGVVRGVREGLNDPHLAARGWFRELCHPDLGIQKYNGGAWRFANWSVKSQFPPPRLGEHSDALLRDLLGLTADEIKTLKTKGVTGAVF